MSKRIIAFLKGGLGNQCFIYAAARALADMTSAELYLSLDYFPGDKIYRRTYALETFRIRAKVLPLRAFPVRQFEELRYKFLRRFNIDRIGNFCLDHPPFSYVPLPLEWRGTLVLDGYWHSYGYYKSAMPAIYNDFALSGDAGWFENDIERKKIAANPKAFFCHVRSYKEVPGHAGGDMSAKLEYYGKALRLMRNKLGDGATCYLFSDDLVWAQTRLAPLASSLGQTIVPVSPSKDVDGQFRDFMLMREFRNGIVGNSSFSGFAGVLAASGARLRGENGVFACPAETIEGYFPDDWSVL